MFPKHQSNYTFYQNSGALLIAIFGALSVADYNKKQEESTTLLMTVVSLLFIPAKNVLIGFSMTSFSDCAVSPLQKKLIE